MRGVDDHATKELPLERMDPHVRVAERRRIDEAADDDPDAGYRSGLAEATNRLRDGAPAEALHARDEPSELAALSARRANAVVIGLSGLGNGGITEFESTVFDQAGQFDRATQHDETAPAGLDRDAEGARHRARV